MGFYPSVRVWGWVLTVFGAGVVLTAITSYEPTRPDPMPGAVNWAAKMAFGLVLLWAGARLRRKAATGSRS